MACNKTKLYCLLGAEKFQKSVFLLEKLKYKAIDKFFPNVKEWYESQLDKQFKRKIRRENIENQEELLSEYQSQKLAFRKELVYRQNRNYHYNPNYPTRFIQYLKWNKKVHVNGIRRDIVSLLGIVLFWFLFGNPTSVVPFLLLGGTVLSLVINFSCVNLQNYNLSRFEDEKTYSFLEKWEERKRTQNLEKLGDAIVPVSKAITSQIALPTVEQVVAQIETKEQAQKLKEYVEEQYRRLEQSQIVEKGKEKVKK